MHRLVVDLDDRRRLDFGETARVDDEIRSFLRSLHLLDDARGIVAERLAADIRRRLNERPAKNARKVRRELM